MFRPNKKSNNAGAVNNDANLVADAAAPDVNPVLKQSSAPELSVSESSERKVVTNFKEGLAQQKYRSLFNPDGSVKRDGGEIAKRVVEAPYNNPKEAKEHFEEVKDSVQAQLKQGSQIRRETPRPEAGVEAAAAAVVNNDLEGAIGKISVEDRPPTPYRTFKI